MVQKIKETSAIKLQVVADIKDGKKVYSTVTFSDISKKFLMTISWSWPMVWLLSRAAQSATFPV